MAPLPNPSEQQQQKPKLDSNPYPSTQSTPSGQFSHGMAEEAVQPQAMANVQPQPKATPNDPLAGIEGGFNVVKSDIGKAGGEVVGGIEAGIAGYEKLTQPIRNVTQGPELGTAAQYKTVTTFKQGGPGAGLVPVESQVLVSPAQGPTQQQRNREAAFLAAGIVPGGELIFAGEKAGAGILADIGGKFALGGAYGGVTSALKGGGPQQIGESALLGGALFGAGPVAGRLGGKIVSGLESSAAAGRYAEISGSLPKVTEAPPSTIPGSSLGRAGAFVTGKLGLQGDVTLFHGTTAANAQEILEGGIKPGSYATPDVGFAQKFAQYKATSAFAAPGSEPAVLKITIPGGQVYKLYETGLHPQAPIPGEATPIETRIPGSVSPQVSLFTGEKQFVSTFEGGPSLFQRFAMKVTGGEPPAPPVGGAGTFRIEGVGAGGEPVAPPGVKPIGQGFETNVPEPKQPPIDLSNFLQDFERSFPTKGTKGFFEGEQLPGPPTKSTPAPATQAPYSGTPGTPFKVDFGAGGGRNVSGYQSRSLFSGDYAIQQAEEAPPVSRGGAAGPGYKGPGVSNELAFSQETSLRTPPGSAFSETQYRFAAFQEPSVEASPGMQSLVSLPGLGISTQAASIPVSSSALKTILPSFSGYKTIVGSGPGQNQGVQQTQQQGSAVITVQQPGSGQQGSYIQNIQQQQQQQTQTPNIAASLAAPLPSPDFLRVRAESTGQGFAGFAAPPSLPAGERGRRKTFGFREIKHPISNILTGGSLNFELKGITPRAFKKGRGKRK